ncbi:MAG: hypothetical protein WD468_06450 [Pirellulales bacterium]
MSVNSLRSWQIILTPLVILAGCQSLGAQQAPPAGPPMATPYPTTTVAPVNVDGPPYLQTAPVIIQPVPQGVPIYPPQSTVVPLPSQTPGSIFGPPAAPPGSVFTFPQAPVGPEQLPPPPGASPVPIAVPGPANPISVPVADDDVAWDQIADVVSDYFTIAREQRARRAGEVWTEGRIDTAPQDGATWLEPHRMDSVGSFNRWESTFQSIRRRATVRVVPDANGYLVEVIVEKELEDLAKPEKATAGAASFRFDGSLPSSRLEDVSRTRTSTRWLSLGRDPALEQRMLAEIHARLNGITNGRVSVFGP